MGIAVTQGFGRRRNIANFRGKVNAAPNRELLRKRSCNSPAVALKAPAFHNRKLTP